jgi:hypothetical protein
MAGKKSKRIGTTGQSRRPVPTAATTGRPPATTASDAPNAAAALGAHILRRSIMRTSEAVWLTAIPALLFVAIYAVLAAGNAELRAVATPQTVDSLLNKWLYAAYFSIASILAYNIFEDYGGAFRSRKFLWFVYIAVFVTFGNTLIAMLLEATAARQPDAGEVTATGTMALSYILSVLALFGYAMFREADIARPGTADVAAGATQASQESDRLARTLASVLPHVKRYWFPAFVTILLTCAMVFGLRSDSVVAYFLSTLAMVGSIVFPLFVHFTPKK